MRTTSSAKTAALRLAEALGWTMESSGSRWALRMPSTAPESEQGVLAWPGHLTGEAALGVMADVATQVKGLAKTWAEVWDLCHYVPRPVKKGGVWTGRWDVEDTWQGLCVQRMLREAHAAGREPLVAEAQD